MGACCKTTTNEKSAQEKYEERRKKNLNEQIKIDTKILDESTSSHKTGKTTKNCLATGDIAKLEEILDSQKINVNDYNGSNKNFFHEAIISTNSAEIIEMLIKKRKADINLPELQTGNTAIFLASVDLKVEIVQTLLRYKPKLNHLNEEKQTVIDFLNEWNNIFKEASERRISSLKRELSPEERYKFEEILHLLNEYKKEHPEEYHKDDKTPLRE